MGWYLDHRVGTDDSPLKKFFCNIIWLKCRTGTIFLLAQRTTSSVLLRYLEHVRKAHRKFSRSTWKKSFTSKNEVLSEYSDMILNFIFQNLNFSRFSWHIIWLVCRTVTIFLLKQTTRSNVPLRYLEHVRKAYRKFSRSTWKKSFTSKNEVLSEYSDMILSFIFQNLNFTRFSWHIIWLVCRTVTIFYWCKQIGQTYLSDTLNMFVNLTEYFLGVLEKKVSPQKMKFYCQNILTWFWASFFKISTFTAFPDI